jgi:methyl-accepting chemotaxis protein
MMLAVKSVQARLDFDIQDARRIANENLRIRTGLDNVTLPVTVSDDRGKLVYLNAAARDLWQTMASDVRQRHPGFSVDKLIGDSLANYFEDQTVAEVYRGQAGQNPAFRHRPVAPQSASDGQSGQGTPMAPIAAA